MKKTVILSAGLVFMLATACDQKPKETTTMNTETDNPLMTRSELPYQAPDWSKIENSHFAPAYEEGLRLQLAEIDEIANNEAAPTFENTLVALEKSGELLTRVSRAFNTLAGANTDDIIQGVQQDMAPKLAAQQDAIYLNSNLFERVNTIYENRKSLKLDDESMRLVEYYHEEFAKAGANLSEEDKTKLKEINEELAGLSAKFSNKLLAATKNGALEIDNQDALAGLSENQITAAKEADASKYRITLQNTTQQPVMQDMDDRETRAELFNASWSRAEKGDDNDTRETISRLASLRADKANILGFDNYAAWSLQTQMAKNPKAVQDFLDQLIGPATANARGEAKDLEKMMNGGGGGESLKPYDWNYYAEKLRLERYDLDESQVKPYFELYTVLENGVFYSATELYGITFERRNDLPVYHEDMRVYEVFDADGSTIGLFYGDYFKRDNKRGGAWMSNMVGQSKLLETKPVIYNVCNYTKPAEGEAALISFDEVITLFHEFGHALHGLFADQTYPSLSGTSVARDFVEYPSQLNEHWALVPKVLKNYAVHYDTGEPMPQDLIDKIKKAATFNQGFALTELLAAASLDMQWHTISADQEITSVDEFEKSALERTKLDMPNVPPRYRSSYFSHIFGGGYAAGYYAYLWTEMLDNDTFDWFEKNGGMTRENGQRFRDMILSRGNTLDYNDMFRNLTGSDPKIEPMLRNRGLLN